MPEKTSPYPLLGAQDQRLGAEQGQLPCRSTGTFSGNCQETKTRMVRARHTPRQPLQNHSSGHIGGWATPRSAEEILYGQYSRVDIHAHARDARKGLLQKRLEEDLCRIIPHFTFTLKKNYNCIVPMGFLPWEIRVAFARESRLRQSRYPTYGACLVFG